MDNEKINKKLLDGIRVIDFTGFSAGPSCSKILQNLGAEVILVESPAGSTTRTNPHLYDFYSMGKKSLVLDLKSEKGKEAMYRLVRTADVFVHNFRNKAIVKLGLDYESLKAINPGIIWAALDGYGLAGPDKDLPGYDTVAFWSRGGMLQDYADKGTVMNPPLAVGDMAAGHFLATAISAALYNRTRTGEGKKVYVSLYGTALYLNNEQIVESQYGSSWPTSRKTPKRSLLNTYKAGDGKWFTLLTTNFDRDFPSIMKVAGREDLIGCPKWKNIFDTMDEGAPEIVEILDEAFKNKPREQILSELKSYDVACAEIRTTTDCYTDPQAWDNKYLFKYTTRENKEVIMAAAPVKIGDNENPEFKLGPVLGQDSAQLLAELGYSAGEIEEMANNKTTIIAG